MRRYNYPSRGNDALGVMAGCGAIFLLVGLVLSIGPTVLWAAWRWVAVPVFAAPPLSWLQCALVVFALGVVTSGMRAVVRK